MYVFFILSVVFLIPGGVLFARYIALHLPVTYLHIRQLQLQNKQTLRKLHAVCAGTPCNQSLQQGGQLHAP